MFKKIFKRGGRSDENSSSVNIDALVEIFSDSEIDVNSSDSTVRLHSHTQMMHAIREFATIVQNIGDIDSEKTMNVDLAGKIGIRNTIQLLEGYAKQLENSNDRILWQNKINQVEAYIERCFKKDQNTYTPTDWLRRVIATVSQRLREANNSVSLEMLIDAVINSKELDITQITRAFGIREKMITNLTDAIRSSYRQGGISANPTVIKQV